MVCTSVDVEKIDLQSGMGPISGFLIFDDKIRKHKLLLNVFFVILYMIRVRAGTDYVGPWMRD